MSMIELESGTIQLGNDSWQHLRRVLEVILPHWLDETRLNGKGIQLFLLQDYTAAISEKEKSPAIVLIRALRERENDPEPVAGYKLLEEMRSGIHVDLLTYLLQKIFENEPQMKHFWEEKEWHENREAGMGQGDGCFRAYKVVFSTWYYDTFLRIYLSHHCTPA